VWTFPGHVVGTTSIDPILLQNERQQMEIEMKRLVQQAKGFPPNIRNIELKYSLADWELARTKTPIRLPVHGYIQSKHSFSISLYTLNQWFGANWSPVENQLRKDATYLVWAKDDPAYRHVQVDGEPAVAKPGRHKKDKQVLATQSDRSHRAQPVIEAGAASLLRSRGRSRITIMMSARARKASTVEAGSVWKVEARSARKRERAMIKDGAARGLDRSRGSRGAAATGAAPAGTDRGRSRACSASAFSPSPSPSPPPNLNAAHPPARRLLLRPLLRQLLAR
jgi:hypothetical protein